MKGGRSCAYINGKAIVHVRRVKMNNQIIRAKMVKYYAVRNGRCPGVYTDVNEYRNQVDGFHGYIARVFYNEKEANDFVVGRITDTELRKERSRKMSAISCALSKENKNNIDPRCGTTQIVAYVDGSHDDNLNKCGYGVVLIAGDDKEILLYGYDKEASKTGLRSVASEISGCMAAIEWAMKKKVKKLTIVCDCFKAIQSATDSRNPLNRFIYKYATMYQNALAKGVDIHFRKIDGHVGNQYNELADALSRFSINKNIKHQLREKIKNGAVDWELKRQKTKS